MNNNLILINADTDSIMVSKSDGSIWDKEEQERFLEALNTNFPEKIKFEHDGIFSRVVVVKSKNYALLPEGETKIKTKGSSIRDAKKEPALREMMEEIIKALIEDRQNELVDIYHKYIKEALNVKDIRRWCQKKTITEAIVDCRKPTDDTRKNEMDVWNAIKNEEAPQQGDKIYVYPVVLRYETIPGGISEKTGKPLKDKVVEITGLKLDKYFSGDHDKEKLVERVNSTIKIFKTILDMEQYIDYSKKKNKHLLEEL